MGKPIAWTRRSLNLRCRNPTDKEMSQGCLYLVATPIGNLSDISPRAKEILGTVDLLACEDTRVTQKLLNHLGLHLPTISYREENEKILALELATKIANGSLIALVSDAGFPGISDPGFRLVRECRVRNLKVTPIPGPTAGISALAASGLPTDRFLFAGFLPAKSAARKRFFEEIKNANHTVILYESRYRILKFLDDLVEILGNDRCICVAREITKLHETFHTGLAQKVREEVYTGSHKGEFSVIIAKAGYQLKEPV